MCTSALDKAVLQIACTHTHTRTRTHTHTHTHTHTRVGPTCLPPAGEAPLPWAAVDPGGVAGVPEAQVTAETLQPVLRPQAGLLHGLRLILLFLT